MPRSTLAGTASAGPPHRPGSAEVLVAARIATPRNLEPCCTSRSWEPRRPSRLSGGPAATGYGVETLEAPAKPSPCPLRTQKCSLGSRYAPADEGLQSPPLPSGDQAQRRPLWLRLMRLLPGARRPDHGHGRLGEVPVRPGAHPIIDRRSDPPRLDAGMGSHGYYRCASMGLRPFTARSPPVNIGGLL
jgi:hypothetical protein